MMVPVMLYQQPKDRRYNLEELAVAGALDKEAVPNVRTLRSWIKAGVLQGPDGKGQGKHYGYEHLVGLLFIQRVQKALKGARLPLKWISAHLDYVDPEAIRRVALGEEELTIVGAEMLQDEWVTGATTEPPAPASLSFDNAPTRPQQSTDESGPWTTINVDAEISLRMRGDDPDGVARLARMAQRLRAWSEEEI